MKGGAWKRIVDNLHMYMAAEAKARFEGRKSQLPDRAAGEGDRSSASAAFPTVTGKQGSQISPGAVVARLPAP